MCLESLKVHLQEFMSSDCCGVAIKAITSVINSTLIVAILILVFPNCTNGH